MHLRYESKYLRIAAQTGSASALGVGGCWFESNLSELKPQSELVY